MSTAIISPFYLKTYWEALISREPRIKDLEKCADAVLWLLTDLKQVHDQGYRVYSTTLNQIMTRLEREGYEPPTSQHLGRAVEAIFHYIPLRSETRKKGGSYRVELDGDDGRKITEQLSRFSSIYKDRVEAKAQAPRLPFRIRLV